MTQSNGFTRRRLLQDSLHLASLGAATALLPPHLRLALAETPKRSGSLSEIKHVVLLMQENRSFDHYFGALAGVRGFDDPNALRLANGRSVFYQPDRQNPLGYLLPFHLDTRSSNAQQLPSNNHTWPVQHRAWNGGRMDQWVSAHRRADGARGAYTMGYFRREDIPFHYALAEAFTICDAYHASVIGPTWPNRLYWMSGTIDPAGAAGGPMIRNRRPQGGLRWSTYPERLEKAGVSWRVYGDPRASATLDVLRLFSALRSAPADSPLRGKALRGAYVGEFEEDVRDDRLPTVSWLLPPFPSSEHPNFMPAVGAAYIAGKLDAIAANREVWAKTAFILSYDENDGLFDHVAPPVPPTGTPGEFVDGVPIGAGFRVPCIVISPWTAGGWVCSEPFDHTSVLRFLERITGVRETNISAWRRQTFGDLTSAFRFDDAKSQMPLLPDTARFVRSAKAATRLPAPQIPAANQSVPRQDAGVRPHVPRGR